MIQYCKRCCLPSTKPHLSFDEEGICNACRNYENRKNVDWDERKKELMEILDRYRSKDGSNWDCIIPVSGGKDSTYQVITMLELGMNPLCVTATTCDLTDIGRRNIENIKKMGVDLAQAILPGCEMPEVGIREGEKLHEIMVTREDSMMTYEYDKHFIVYPHFDWWDNSKIQPGGKKVESGFEYSSGKNTEWLSVDEIARRLKDVKEH